MNIVFCLPGKIFSGNFLKSWTSLIFELPKLGINPIISQQYSPLLFYVRNMCLGGNVLKGINQKPFDNQFEYDYTMWLDSDMVFKPEDFLKLLKNGEDGKKIVSGIYPIDSYDYSAVSEWNKEQFLLDGGFKFINKDDLKNGKFKTQPEYPLMEVPYNGFGFMLIKREVFESLQYPWFNPHFLVMKNH